MSTPAVAIIIPAYKPDFLRATLDSIAAQTVKDFHVYVANDCSPHDLHAIVKDFENILPLTYHRFEKNMGGSDLVGHWHRSIRLSGDEKWIWMWSDDDIMQPRCIESFLQLPTETRSSSLVHFQLDILDSATGQLIPSPRYPEPLSADEYLRGKLTCSLTTYVVAFIFPRSLSLRAGGFENFDLAWGADFMTWVKMAALSDGIVTVDAPESKVLWRRSDLNISPDFSYPTTLRKLSALIDNAAFLKSFMKEHPESFPSTGPTFRWLRFPLGEIYRKRSILKPSDILRLNHRYRRQVGFAAQATAACGASLISKTLKR